MPSKTFTKRVFELLLALAFLLFCFDLWLGLHHQVRLRVMQTPVVSSGE